MGASIGCLEKPNKKIKIVPRSLEQLNFDPNIVIEWQAERCTEKYHWWPMLDKDDDIEDPVNNLFAIGGGLDKYDKIFLTKSREYQYRHHRIPPNSERADKYWAGFCDRAACLSCLYDYPRKHVTVQVNDREIEFSPSDIEALMICAEDRTIRKGMSLFFGERNNLSEEELLTLPRKNARNAKQEPYPLELIEILKKLTSELGPFVVDIDNGDAVWNYPYDEVIVRIENNKYFQSKLFSQGKNRVYRFQLLSSAYPEKNMNFVGLVNKHNNQIRQKWLSKENPDFLWKQYPNINCWSGKSRLNPYLDAFCIYQIYLQSISRENKIVKFKI